MIFGIMKDKEIKKKAKDLGGYYTAEFAIGYMMTHHPVLFLLDIIVPVVVMVSLILALE